MNSHRTRTSILTVLAIVVSVALPTAATASSLLSGYGGPGQGNQAILGSALLNGPSGGGGGGSGGGSAAGTGNLAVSSSGGGETRPKGVAHRRGAKHGAGTGGIKASAGGSSAYSLSTGLAASRTASGGTGTLGLSGADMVYILLALGVLALTGGLTRQLMRRAR
jgi:hypothetical protein